MTVSLGLLREAMRINPAAGVKREIATLARKVSKVQPEPENRQKRKVNRKQHQGAKADYKSDGQKSHEKTAAKPSRKAT